MADNNKLQVVIPNEDKFDPAPLPFVAVYGKGVPDYDHKMSNGKRGEMQFTASVLLTKKEAKFFRQEVLEFWEDNKPKGASDEPKNWKNIVRDAKDSTDGRDYIVYAKSKTEFDGEPNTSIAIVNGDGDKLDPEQFGTAGKGSVGRILVTLATYGTGSDAGVSVYISAVKYIHHVPPSGGDAAAAFGKKEGGDIKGNGGFKSEKKKDSDSEKPKKKKKKKKKKNK